MESQMTDSYAKAYVQILEIIKHMGKEYIEKIPKKLLDFFEENKDKNYIFELGKQKENTEQIFSKETLGLLAMIELDYWATEEEKKIINKALEENERKFQAEMRKKYNPDNVFKNKETKVEKLSETEKTTKITEYKESIFTKIKKWFKRNI